MNDSLKSTLSEMFAIVGMTSFCRQARASGHLDLAGCKYWAAKLYVLPYMMCTSTGTFAVTSMCSCSQLHDLASQNMANRIASMAACVLRLCVGRGMVVSGVCSCV